jgi:hypothetical protein
MGGPSGSERKVAAQLSQVPRQLRSVVVCCSDRSGAQHNTARQSNNPGLSHFFVFGVICAEGDGSKSAPLSKRFSCWRDIFATAPGSLGKSKPPRRMHLVAI